jgi:hypothetical protein
MATAQRSEAAGTKRPRTAYVPPIDEDELLRRNLAAVALLDSWEVEGDELEQRETLEVLREALGERRSGSSRPAFP